VCCTCHQLLCTCHKRRGSTPCWAAWCVLGCSHCDHSLDQHFSTVLILLLLWPLLSPDKLLAGLLCMSNNKLHAAVVAPITLLLLFLIELLDCFELGGGVLVISLILASKLEASQCIGPRQGGTFFMIVD